MNKEQMPEPQPISITTDATTSVSPACTKPTVGCCTPLVKTAMQCHIIRLKQLRNIYQIGTPQHNCFSIAINEAMVELVKEKKQIEVAFSEGFGCSCFSIDQSSEQYFNNTFK